MLRGTILLHLNILCFVRTIHICRTLGNNLGSRLSVHQERPRHLALGTTGLEVQRIATLSGFLLTTDFHRSNLQRIFCGRLQFELSKVESYARCERTLNFVKINVVEGTGQLERSGSRIFHARDIGERHRNLTCVRTDFSAIFLAELNVTQRYLSQGAKTAKECHKGESRNLLHKLIILVIK